MKKLLLILLCLPFTGLVMAQTELEEQNPLNGTTDKTGFASPVVKQQTVRAAETDILRMMERNSLGIAKKASVSAFYSYPIALAGAGVADFTNSIINRPLHPDTLLTVLEDNTTQSNGYLSAATIFDPKSSIFEFDQNTETVSLTIYNDFVWDSLRFPYTYQRPIDSFNNEEVVDTVYVQYYLSNRIDRSIVWLPANPGGDTIPFATVQYNPDRMRSTVVSAEDTLFLTMEDTTTVRYGFFTSAIDQFISNNTINGTRNSNSVIGASITFKPGYPVDDTDTLRDGTSGSFVYKHNSFNFREFIDQSTYSELDATNNTAYILDGMIYDRDSYDPQSPWLNRYFASNAPSNSNFYADLQFHISSQTVSVPEDAKSSINSTVYPNPATENDLKVRFENTLTKFVKIDLYNMNGQKVLNIQNAEVPAGSHEFSADVSGLTPGGYVMKIMVGGEVKSTLVNIQ